MGRISIDMKSGALDTASNDKEIIIGIDLGTTNSLVAYIENGQPKAVKDQRGQHTLMPSVVHFPQEGTPVVGQEAKQYLISDPSNTIYSVKRFMGRSFEEVEKQRDYFGYRIIDEKTSALVKIAVRDTYHTPIELSALILNKLKLRIENQLNKTVQKAVITVPAYFDDNQRQATRAAGKLAGLDVLRIINEPTAAALAYGIGVNQDEDRTIAVYDLGGGTFDISILSLQQGVFEVLATNGDTFLGGDDIDRAILNYWKARYDLDEVLNNDQSLRLLAEEAKKTLSESTIFQDTFKGQTFELSLEAFNQLIQPILDKTLDCCKNALKDAQLTIRDIDEIILVGGSTRTPLIGKKLADFFQKPVHNDLNPDEVVALGAAVQADILAGNNKDILLLDITPLSLGIETVGGLMDVILPRNSKVPCRVGRQYTTSVDGQKNLKVAVYQGERDLVKDNRKLGEFTLSNIPPMPAGLPKIEIHFILDADGILVVRAKELRSGVEQNITIQSQYGISEEEMAKMLLDSIQNASKDVAIKGLIEARNEGNNIVAAAHKFLGQHENILSETEINGIKELTKQLEESIKSESKDAINQAMEKLNEFTKPLAHRAMDTVIAEAMSGKKI